MVINFKFQIGDVGILTNCRTHGIGHLAIEPAWFVAKRCLYNNPYKKKIYVLLLSNLGVANTFLLNLWKKDFIIFDDMTANEKLKKITLNNKDSIDIGIAPTDSEISSSHFTFNRNLRHVSMIQDIQRFRLIINQSFLDLPLEIVELGHEKLRKIGISEDDWFVCIHAGETTLDKRWAYEPFRRNKIEDYRGLIEYINNKGGKVIRMGHPLLPSIPTDFPNIIDYPKTEIYSDWMDIFLVYKCKHFIGCQSGLQSVAVLFGKKILLTNIIPWPFVIGFDGDVFLIKLLKEKKSNRIIQLQEYILKGLHREQFRLPEDYEPIANSGDDLINAYEELENTTLFDNEGEKLYKLWCSYFTEDSQFKHSNVRMSYSFLKKWGTYLF